MRTCVDRLTGDGDHTIAREMAEVAVQELHQVEIAKDEFAVLELRHKQIRVLPPIGKRKRYPALDLTVLHAESEKNLPTGGSSPVWQ